MWITSLGIWARKGHKEASSTWDMPSAVQSMPSGPNEVTLLELLVLVSYLSELGDSSFTPCWAQKLPKSVRGPILLPMEFSQILRVAECTSGELLNSLACHWAHQAACLHTDYFCQALRALRKCSQHLTGSVCWVKYEVFFSGNLCAWIENHLFQFILRTDAAYTHFLYL